MKKKASIVVAILLLAVGFAAVSTTLIINGSAKIGENADDFSVIFTAATLDGTDVYANVIDNTKKTITFETSGLKTLNQTSVLNYEVTNNSANYDAEVQVNCKVKDNTTAKYTSIKNELEGNATVIKAKESVNGTLTVTLNKTATEEVKENYVCELIFNAVEREILGKVHENVFATDSWSTIASNVKAGNTSQYEVGDTKEVNLGDLGTHIVRISNKSECESETSETACGFVVEFADIIAEREFNRSRTNVGGWRDSNIRTYVNGTLYNALPSDLQNIILTTKVISDHGDSDSANFETQDKLYLLSSEEIGDNKFPSTALNTSRELDYYRNQKAIKNDSTGLVKLYNGRASEWWLRSVWNISDSFSLCIYPNGGSSNIGANASLGVSPAYRIA